ncbi:MAG: relaxase domain-containing protein [Hydrococcus sp. RM1_1_31]|nr:relaxase domain-containing protein [Hydrococcus sp. RM1_1_31]
MLTTKVITPRQGESYYAKENYYSAEESVEQSEWIGQGAKKLGLKGQVTAKNFKKLLYGELPNGTRFRKRKKERAGYKERAGLDCTFSAPKSVSIQALVYGDKRLEEIAHREAVRRTLEIVERNYATTRVMVEGKIQVIKTHNLVIGQFHHDTSRELDPHLHTHCVIINATKAENGKWYSLRTDDIFANRKLLGMIYQNELALQVQKLGYEIEHKEHGQFEIKGFTQEQLESFSKRRQQIKTQLGEESTWKKREKVWDKTRIAKENPFPEANFNNIGVLNLRS